MLKDIMVHLDQAPSCQNRLDAAVALARQHEARLTGLYVHSSPRQKDPQRETAEINKRFQEQTRDAGLVTEFLDVEIGFQQTGVAEMVGYYASFTDLLIVSQPLHADNDKRYAMITSPERLLLGTGRPVLIIPRHGSFTTIGERILVAWKAGPKASRATHDAMPLLRRADHVSMVSVGDARFRPGEGERLAQYLSSHGVTADVEQIPAGDLSIGDTLLNLVADDSIDMMVFGVHIVTRRGHLDMGVVGSYLLDHMTVPMLLSH